MYGFDEYGRPKFPWSQGFDDLVDRSLQPPPEQPQGFPDVQPPAPNIQNYLSRTPTPDDPYGGINTSGPSAMQAQEAAASYRTPSTPQQFGQDQSVDPNEGPLSPQATAEAMPATADAMQKLINQHMLRGPKEGPKYSKDGYQNYVTASREKRAAEKDQLRQQGALNRAERAAKESDVQNQLVTQNAMQGAGPGVGGGSSYGGSSGGPSVRNIGGYKFVSGTWRPQTPEESAKVNNINANTDLARQKPGLDMMDMMSRMGIAKSNQQARANESEADRELRKLGLLEGNRHHKAMEDNAAADDQRKTKETLAKKYEEEFEDLEQTIAQLQEREFFGGDAFKAQMPNDFMKNFKKYTSDRTPFLDTDYTQVDKTDPENPKKGVLKPGSYERGVRNAIRMFDQIEAARKSGLHTHDLRDELKKYLEDLRASYPN